MYHRDAIFRRTLPDLKSSTVAFTSEPLRVDELFEIRIRRLDARFAGGVRIGLTTLNPPTSQQIMPLSLSLPHLLPPCTAWWVGGNSCYQNTNIVDSENPASNDPDLSPRSQPSDSYRLWHIQKVASNICCNLSLALVDDTVGVMQTESGALRLYINGVNVGDVMQCDATNVDTYGVLELDGRCNAVQITSHILSDVIHTASGLGRGSLDQKETVDFGRDYVQSTVPVSVSQDSTDLLLRACPSSLAVASRQEPEALAIKLKPEEIVADRIADETSIQALSEFAASTGRKHAINSQNNVASALDCYTSSSMTLTQYPSMSNISNMDKKFPKLPVKVNINANFFFRTDIHGSNVSVSQCKTRATKSSSSCSNSLLFTCYPLTVNTLFRISIGQVDHKCSGGISIGLVSGNFHEAYPTNEDLPTTALQMLTDSRVHAIVLTGSSVFYNQYRIKSGFSPGLDRLTYGSTVAMYVDSNYNLRLLINDIDYGIASCNAPSNASIFLDLNGAVNEVSIVNNDCYLDAPSSNSVQLLTSSTHHLIKKKAQYNSNQQQKQIMVASLHNDLDAKAETPMESQYKTDIILSVHDELNLAISRSMHASTSTSPVLSDKKHELRSPLKLDLDNNFDSSARSKSKNTHESENKVNSLENVCDINIPNDSFVEHNQSYSDHNNQSGSQNSQNIHSSGNSNEVQQEISNEEVNAKLQQQQLQSSEEKNYLAQSSYPEEKFQQQSQLASPAENKQMPMSNEMCDEINLQVEPPNLLSYSEVCLFKYRIISLN